MSDAIETRLQADLRERESQWLLAGLGLVVVFGIAGALAFSIARGPLEQTLSVLAGLAGVGFFLLFRWNTQRQSEQILSFARQLGPELRDARFTAIAGFVFIFRNGVFFQWYYASRVNLFIGFRMAIAHAGYPLVPGIDDVGRWTSDFFWGKELGRVARHAGPEALRARLEALAQGMGYDQGWITVQETRSRELSSPEQARWFVSCGFLGGRFWRNGPAIAGQLDALRRMLEEARMAAVAPHA